MIEEALTWSKKQRKLKEKDKQVQRDHLTDIRNQQGRIRATLALRSGYERRCQADAIEKLAAQEWQEASNGVQN
jgi:hypothetical protein